MSFEIKGHVKGNPDPSNKMSLNTVFGDKIVATRTPSIAAQFQYPLKDGDAQQELLNGGTVGYDQSRLFVKTGTASNGSARIQSRENIRYIPGHELYCLFTAAFTQGVANSRQRAGIYDGSNGFFVGYEGIDFCFCRMRNGVVEDKIIIDIAKFNSENGMTFDPTMMYIFRISYGYLGVAPITLNLVKPDNSIVEMAKIEYTGTSVLTHTTQTFLPVRGEVVNSGNTSDLAIYVGSLSAGIVDGSVKDTTTGRSFSSSLLTPKTIVIGNNTIVSFRNLSIFNGIPNRVKSRLVLISSSSELNKPISFRLVENPQFIIPGTWTPHDAGNSIMEVSADAVVDYANQGKLFIPWELAKVGQMFENVDIYALDLYPGETASFIANTNGSGEVLLGIRWVELF